MKKRAAFTLAELMIALAITAILVVLLANVVSATLNAWQQGRNRLDTFSSARQLIGRIGDEIGAARAVDDKIEFVENAGELGTGAAAPTPTTSENIFFVAPYPNSGAGDLCVIAYRHDAVGHRLERAFKDSAQAWNAGAGSRYKVTGHADNFEWRPIADGVIEFEIRSYSQEDLDNNVSIPGDSWSSRAAGNTTTEGKTPRRIVLRLKVVDDRTLVRLATMTPGSGPYNDALTRGAREFFADFSLPPR
ncbi:hypothetical protein BH20VER1_BH20VER1_08270 [soil metagenome]